MKKIYVCGASQTKFGYLREDIGTLMLIAAKKAISQSKIDLAEIEAIIVANFSSSFTQQCHLPSLLASRLNTNKEIVRVESACAAGSVAIKEAAIYLESGLYQTVMVVGVEKMSEVSMDMTTLTLAMAASPEERRHGATFPSQYALIARTYLEKYGVNEVDLAKVAVKNHHNALLNPLAHFHKKIDVETVLKSRMIASPLKLLDCSPISDGAAAVILSTKKSISHPKNRPVRLIGWGHAVDAIELYKRRDLASIPVVALASKKAYKMADLLPRDINIAELHDCFTIAELIEMEELGFCKKGEAKEMIRTGKTELTGELPINTSGGLKAKGHPIGATGVSQVVEIVKQLQNKAAQRQVKNVHKGLCCNIGGSGGSCVVTIFSN